jgi:hypothetical protein
MSVNDVRLSSLWRRHSVEMPVCAGCRAALLTKRRFMRFSLLVLAALLVAFLYWAWVIYGGKHGKLFVRLGGLAFIPPLVFLWIMLRMPASMEEEAGKLEYWFENPEFAREFRELNGIREVESFDFLDEM